LRRGARRAAGQTSGQNADVVAPSRRTRAHHVEIFVISLAALLLEIAYTRVVSFKLYYYYTYFVIGLALLGLGSGAVVMTVSQRLRRTSTDDLLRVGLFSSAVAAAGGYLVVARIPVASRAIWDYGSGTSFKNLAALLVVCLTIFAGFFIVGVMISAILGRGAERVGRLYFADLAGAGLASLAAVPLLDSIGAPGTVFLAGSLLAAMGTWVALRTRRSHAVVGGVLVLLTLVPVFAAETLPIPRVDDFKTQVTKSDRGEWNAVFRVDARPYIASVLLFHDSLIGSAIHEWDGDPASLSRFDEDPRSFAFTIDEHPGRVLIIGAAGGHEVLSSIYFGAEHVDAVELNPVTYQLVKGRFADYGGRIAERDDVSWIQGDGRSFLSRTDRRYDVVWYPAPDSYAATNAANAGAFVLSESYLYTVESVEESLEHLNPDGLLIAQFGEQRFERAPKRTSRYVSTVRAALRNRGIEDPSAHVMVLTSPYEGSEHRNATILVKASPFTADEVQAITRQAESVEGSMVEYEPGAPGDASPISQILTRSPSDLERWYDSYEYDVRPVTDDGPFFWHFARFTDVIRDLGDPINPRDPEDMIGERVMLLLLLVTVILGIVFLLAPFVAVRSTWSALPVKGLSAVYFGALGFGFMFFEITLIQRLTLFLGYPTYSLTVTLAALLIFTGIGAALSPRTTRDPNRAIPALVGVIVALSAFYRWGLTPVTEAFFETGLAVRVLVAFVVLAPLGLCLGTFMPLGLTKVASLTEHSTEYVAWGWAVNAFASVVGATLATVLAMTFGFDLVLVLALVVYLVALAAMWRLVRVPARA
jgi:hypothetical protein